MKYKVLKVFCYILIALSIFQFIDFSLFHTVAAVAGIVASVIGIRLANGKKIPKCSLAIAAAATILFSGSIYADQQVVKQDDTQVKEINLSDEDAKGNADPAMMKASILIGMPFVLAPSLLYMAAFREAWNNEK